jgi:hypothetical protein
VHKATEEPSTNQDQNENPTPAPAEPEKPKLSVDEYLKEKAKRHFVVEQKQVRRVDPHAYVGLKVLGQEEPPKTEVKAAPVKAMPKAASHGGKSKIPPAPQPQQKPPKKEKKEVVLSLGEFQEKAKEASQGSRGRGRGRGYGGYRGRGFGHGVESAGSEEVAIPVNNDKLFPSL